MNAGIIRDSLRTIVNAKQVYARLCKVESVDDSAMTCIVSYIDNPDIKVYDVLLATSKEATQVIIPENDSMVLIDWLNESQAYVAMFSEVKQHYMATTDESILDIMNDLVDAILAIQLTHPYGPTTSQGVINLTDFQDVKQRLQKFFLK